MKTHISRLIIKSIIIVVAVMSQNNFLHLKTSKMEIFCFHPSPSLSLSIYLIRKVKIKPVSKLISEQNQNLLNTLTRGLMKITLDLFWTSAPGNSYIPPLIVFFQTRFLLRPQVHLHLIAQVNFCHWTSLRFRIESPSLNPILEMRSQDNQKPRGYSEDFQHEQGGYFIKEMAKKISSLFLLKFNVEILFVSYPILNPVWFQSESINQHV